MDHNEVLEQLELAAVEPDGLARLVAGDTATAAAVAGHLAGCESCSSEFQRLGRAAPLLREVVRTTPPSDLRERTLAYVREHGEPRGVAASAAAVATTTRAPAPVSLADAVPRRRASLLPWVATLAAAVALAVATTSFLAYQQASQRLADQEHAVADLVAVTSATVEISAQPDVERVSLTATGTETSGSLLFSPASTRLVVVATGLQRPPSGQEYRCWVDRAGTRENVGRMFFAGDLAYWVGKVPAISDVAPGTTFGVSLADLQGTLVDGPPVIAGEL